MLLNNLLFRSSSLPDARKTKTGVLKMNEIKAEPYIPDEDYDNPAMSTDFYEFTMANALFLKGFKDSVLVFDMFFRRNPDDQGYSISCGQRKLVRFLQDYHFTDRDIAWLRCKGMSEEFCEYLRDYRWKGDIYMLKEGTVCYPQVPMVRVECDMVGAILIETYLLQTMNFHSLIATKATKVTGINVRSSRNVMEFGTRRAHGESAGIDGAYAAVMGGCIGTANCLAEMRYGPSVKAVGTVAHSFIEFFPDEYEAFKAYADIYPDNVSLLLDTYSTFESGLPNLIKIDDYMAEKYPDDPGRRVKSARIDSGNLTDSYSRLREVLDKAGKQHIKLVASGSLDEGMINDMELRDGASFDSYGVGEKLITSSSDPVFGGVYKLVAVKESDGSYTPKMKCSDSESKAIIPGKLMAWRVFDEEGKGQCDIISMDDEKFKAGDEIEVIGIDPEVAPRDRLIRAFNIEKLLVPHLIHGKLAIDLPDMETKKAYVRDQLENSVPQGELLPGKPQKHYVGLTVRVADMRTEMYARLHGGKI